MKTLFLTLLFVLAGCGHPHAVQKDGQGDWVMLLGHDPVAYFSRGKPVRGHPQIRANHEDVTYYFTTQENRERFAQNPDQFVPQYGGFCSSGAAFGIKLGSDPTEFVIRDGRLFIFGDIAGKTAWLIDPGWNIKHADQVWPEAAPNGWRWQSLKRYMSKVAWYKDTGQILADYKRKNPDTPWPDYDPGGMMTNLFAKQPGWRAREGFGGQPVVGFVGVDPCPPACPGEVSPAFGQ